MYKSLKLLPNNSIVSQKDRKCYVSDSMSLTIWFDKKEEIFAFFLVFDLLLDECAFIHRRNGPTRYGPVDQGDARVGRHDKQTIQESQPMPTSRLNEFEKVSLQLPEKEYQFVVCALRKFLAYD